MLPADGRSAPGDEVAERAAPVPPAQGEQHPTPGGGGCTPCGHHAPSSRDLVTGAAAAAAATFPRGYRAVTDAGRASAARPASAAQPVHQQIAPVPVGGRTVHLAAPDGGQPGDPAAAPDGGQPGDPVAVPDGGLREPGDAALPGEAGECVLAGCCRCGAVQKKQAEPRRGGTA
eukprot:1178158-Prorocentrum_minimum.AAC.1